MADDLLPDIVLQIVREEPVSILTNLIPTFVPGNQTVVLQIDSSDSSGGTIPNPDCDTRPDTGMLYPRG